MPGGVTENVPCKVCEKRKARYVDGCCEPCHFRVIAEGTHDQLGVAKEAPTRQRWREVAAVYNRMALGEGKSQTQIAEHLGMQLTQLRSMIYRMKKEAGIKVVDMTRSRGGHKPGPPTNVTRRRANGHGEGHWGKKGCDCDLCVERVKQSRSIVDADKRQRLADMKKRLAELEAMVAKKK